MSSSKKVLFVLSSHGQFPNGHPTGWYLPEVILHSKQIRVVFNEYFNDFVQAAHPYYVLEPHFTIDFASLKGGKAPLDLSSVENFKNDQESQQFLADEKAKQGYENTKKLSDINANDYAAIVYVGGHGPCYDLPEDPTNIQLAQQFWEQGKIVSAVCHGPAAIGIQINFNRKLNVDLFLFYFSQC